MNFPYFWKSSSQVLRGPKILEQVTPAPALSLMHA